MKTLKDWPTCDVHCFWKYDSWYLVFWSQWFNWLKLKLFFFIMTERFKYRKKFCWVTVSNSRHVIGSNVNSTQPQSIIRFLVIQTLSHKTLINFKSFVFLKKQNHISIIKSAFLLISLVLLVIKCKNNALTSSNMMSVIIIIFVFLFSDKHWRWKSIKTCLKVFIKAHLSSCTPPLCLTWTQVGGIGWRWSWGSLWLKSLTFNSLSQARVRVCLPICSYFI